MKVKDRFRIMGIVNVTPDSFSDGGLYASPAQAFEQCLRLVDAGADYIDLGAESTRPGAAALTAQAEWQRLQPVFERLGQRDLGARISVDTRNTATMVKAVAAGARMINNVAGLVDDPTLKHLAGIEAMEYVAMHMAGTPANMQQHPLNGAEAVEKVESFFATATEKLLAAGFGSDQIWVDPGIGFGKTDPANLRLLAMTKSWSDRFNLVLGVSRKSWIGRSLNVPLAQDRDKPSKLLELGLWISGAKLIRTHDVRGLGELRNLLQRAD